MNVIKSRYIKKPSGKKWLEIEVFGQFMSFGMAANLKEFKGRKLTADVLHKRWKAGDRTFKRLFRPKSFENVSALHYKKNRQVLETFNVLGKELGKKPGEICIGFFTPAQLRLADYWKTQRFGRMLKDERLPLFIKKSEAEEKGWLIR